MKKIQILKNTAEYRGDHSADVSEALELKEGETLEQLIESELHHHTDWIEIRLVKNREEDKNG